MPVANTRGFVPTRHITGHYIPSPGPLRPTDGANASQLYPGDVVYLDASGRLQRATDAASGEDTRLPLGVIAQVFNSDARPFTFNQPSIGGPFIPVSTRGFATVYEDPGIIYLANCSATATFQDVGDFVQVRVCAPATAVGRSGMGVDLPGVNTAAGHYAKLVAVSPQDGLLDEVGLSGGANNDVEVMLVNTIFSNPHRRIEVGVGASATG